MSPREAASSSFLSEIELQQSQKGSQIANGYVHIALANLIGLVGGWLAAQAFLKYRRSGGVKTSPLPDFYIGAHAEVGGHTLVTRGPSRYRTYFPSVRLIVPPNGKGDPH